MNASSEESFLVLRKFHNDSPTVHLLFAWGVMLPPSRSLLFRAIGKVTATADDGNSFAITEESGFFFAAGTEDWLFEYATSKEAPTSQLSALLKPDEEIEDLIIGRPPFGGVLYVYTLK